MGGWRRAGAAVVALALAAVLGSCGGGGEGGPSVDPTRTPTASPTRSANLPSPTRSPIRSDSPTETTLHPSLPTRRLTPSLHPSLPTHRWPPRRRRPHPPPLLLKPRPPKRPTVDRGNPSGDDRRACRRGRGRGFGGRAGLGLVAACSPGLGTRRRHSPAGQVTPEQGLEIRPRRRGARGGVVGPRSPAQSAAHRLTGAGARRMGRLVRTGSRARRPAHEPRGDCPGRLRPGARAHAARRRTSGSGPHGQPAGVSDRPERVRGDRQYRQGPLVHGVAGRARAPADPDGQPGPPFSAAAT